MSIEEYRQWAINIVAAIVALAFLWVIVWSFTCFIMKIAGSPKQDYINRNRK